MIGIYILLINKYQNMLSNYYSVINTKNVYVSNSVPIFINKAIIYPSHKTLLFNI